MAGPYYIEEVADGGSDSNSGTIGSPYATIVKACQRIIADNASPHAETVYIRAGTYNQTWDASVQAIPSGVDDSNRVIFKAYPNESVTINGEMEIRSASYVTFQDFVLNASNFGSQNNAVHDNAPASTVTHIRFQNVTIKNGDLNGVGIGGNFYEFVDCTVFDNGDNLNADIPPTREHNFYCAGTDGLIDGCEIYNGASAGITLYPGTSTGWTVSNCLIYNNGEDPVSIIYGYGIGCDGSGGGNHLIYNNIVHGNMGAGIQVASNCDNCRVYFNTVYSNGHGTGGGGANGINCYNNTGLDLRNNISLENTAQDISFTNLTSPTYDYNMYYAADFSPAAHDIVSDGSTNYAKWADPDNGDFTILGTGLEQSPAAYTGIKIDGFPTDFNNFERPDPPSIGAIEAYSPPEDPHVNNVNGYDICYFSDSGLTTALNWQSKFYDPMTGQIVHRVKRNTNLTIYMGYGKASITTFQGNINGTWNSAYKGVWLLGDGTTLSVADSTSNGNNGTNHSATAGAALHDGGAVFNGTTQYINGTLAVAGSIPVTMMAWFKLSSTGVFAAIFSIDADGANGMKIGVYNSDYFAFSLTGVADYVFTTLGTLSAGTWYFGAVSIDSNNGTVTAYLGADGGTLNSEQQIIGAPIGAMDKFHIGVKGNATQDFFPGTISDVQYFASALAAGPITEEFYQGSEPDSFITFGNEGPGTNGFAYKRTITINPSQATQTDFPVLISLTEDTLIFTSASVSGLAPISGAGSLTAVPRLFVKALAAISGTGSLSAVGMKRVTGACVMSGTGSLSALAKFVTGAAAISGAGSLSAAPSNHVIGASALSGAGSLSAVTGGIITAASAMSGAGSLSAVPSNHVIGACVITGAGTLSALPVNHPASAAILTGTGSLVSAYAVSATTGSGFAAISGVGSLSVTGASGTVHVVAAALLTGAGDLSAFIVSNVASADYATVHARHARIPEYRVTITLPISLAGGLEAGYEFEESVGAASREDITDGNNDLSPHGNPTSTTGKVGDALLLDRSLSQYLDITVALGSPFYLRDRVFGGTVWVKLASKPAGLMTIASQYGLVSARSWWLLWDNVTDRFLFVINDSQGNQAVVSADVLGAPNIGDWYFIRFWRTMSAIYISVNNQETPDFTPTGVVAGTSVEPFRIGASGITGAPGSFWDGAIDQFLFYLRLLSETDGDILYNNGDGAAVTELLDEPFIEGQGYTFCSALSPFLGEDLGTASLEPISLDRRVDAPQCRFPLCTFIFNLNNVTGDALAALSAGIIGWRVDFYQGFWDILWAGNHVQQFAGTVTETAYRGGTFRITARSFMARVQDTILFQGAINQLAASMATGDTTATLVDATYFSPATPLGEWGHVLIDNQVIPYRGITSSTLTGLIQVTTYPFAIPPVLAGSESATHAINSTVRELISVGPLTGVNDETIGTNDQHPIDQLIRMITTVNTNRAIGDLGIEVDTNDLASIKTSLGAQLRYRFLFSEGTNAKKMMEEQYLKTFAAYPLESRTGIISLKLFRSAATFSSTGTITDAVCVDRPHWIGNAENQINTVVIRYDYNPFSRAFGNVFTYADDNLVSKHGRPYTLFIDSYGLRSRYDQTVPSALTWFTATAAHLRAVAVRYVARFGERCPIIRATTTFSPNLHELGDDVTCTFSQVVDLDEASGSVSGGKYEIIGMKHDYKRGVIEIDLCGYAQS